MNEYRSGAGSGHINPQTTARYAHMADQPTQNLNDEVGGWVAKVTRNKKSEAEALADNAEELERLKELVAEAVRLKESH